MKTLQISEELKARMEAAEKKSDMERAVAEKIVKLLVENNLSCEQAESILLNAKIEVRRQPLIGPCLLPQAGDNDTRCLEGITIDFGGRESESHMKDAIGRIVATGLGAFIGSMLGLLIFR